MPAVFGLRPALSRSLTCLSSRWISVAAATMTIAALGATTAAPARADSVLVDPDVYLPGNVDSTAFYDLVAQVADRWSITIDGTSSAVAGDQDGVNVVSFTPDLSSDTLGAYIYWYHPVYKYWRVKECHRTSSGRR